jgi:IS5 family transposase
MHQTKKGNQWYFGMKAQFGVDSRTKLIQAVVATPANVADSTVLSALLHGKEPVYGVIRPTVASGQQSGSRRPAAERRLAQ